MAINLACAGECIYEDFNLEYQITELEFIKNKSISIVAICYNPRATIYKEITLKYSTKNLNSPDEQLKLSLAMTDSIINNLSLNKEKLYKLVINDNKIFFIHSI
jgi:hypothetical protein